MARSFEPLEIGVMFWAGRDPSGTLDELKQMGLRCGQLGLRGDLDLRCAGAWKAALSQADFSVYTVFAAFEGESYADVRTVECTVGFVPPETRQAREARMLRVSDFAAEIGAPSIATHVGCLPQDPIEIREMVRRICDYASAHRQTFALETGQESAEALLEFLHDVNRENLGINFDPANMILYGTGDPIEALGLLAENVLSVHCKDGEWPSKDQPGTLGEERPLGQGAVGIERFITELKRIGYTGPLAIEREGLNASQWPHDVRAAVRLLEQVIKA